MKTLIWSGPENSLNHLQEKELSFNVRGNLVKRTYIIARIWQDGSGFETCELERIL